jgi:hypothetical protein
MAGYYRFVPGEELRDLPEVEPERILLEPDFDGLPFLSIPCLPTNYVS